MSVAMTDNPALYEIGSVFIDSNGVAVQRVARDLFVWTDGDSASLSGIVDDIARGEYTVRLIHDAETSDDKN